MSATQKYTAIGYWNDSDELIITGIIRGEHEIFGGEGCSEGGPWGDSFEADNDEHAEILAAKIAREESGFDADDETEGE